MRVMLPPETQYARGEEGDVAFQVFGSGPRTVLFIQNWGNNIEAMWDEPELLGYFERLASFCRVIVFDKRGSGISDPVPLDSLPTLERWMDDARLVLDAADAGEVAAIGDTEGGPMAMLLAATHPSRVSSLILVNSFARFLRAPDYRIGVPPRTAGQLVDAWQREWGTGDMLELTAPSIADDARARRWFGRYQRLSMSPRQALNSYRWVLQVDVRSVLPAIQAPTLILHRRDSRYYRTAYGQYLARSIAGARLVVVPGADTYPFHVDAAGMLDQIELFLTGARARSALDRVLATVLFTDIVGSTRHAARLGDAEWRKLLDRHREIVRAELANRGGQEHATIGDGFLATFDGPGRALRCASAIVEAVRELGIEVRIGVHTGEVELGGGSGELAGIAVHIAARVVAIAQPSTVWVTGTVRDLVIGSGIEFAERGEHELKGVPEAWRLYEVTAIPG